MHCLVTRPHPDLGTKAGAFSSYRGKKGKWGAVAKRAGLAKADGDRLNDAAEGHYKACCESWTAMLQNVASRVIADAIAEAQPSLQPYRDSTRSAAILAFDVLLLPALDFPPGPDDAPGNRESR